MHKDRRNRIWLALLLAAFLLEQQIHLQVTVTHVSSPRLPEAFDGFRIVQLSDLHGRQFGRDNRWLLETVASLSPDLIAVTGDLLDQAEDAAASEQLLSALSAIAPTCFVTGNHEWSLPDLPAVLTGFSRAGAIVLQNRGLLLCRGDASLILAGVNDPCGPYDMISPEDLCHGLREASGEDAFLLLLAHRNETPEKWAGTGADLVLAGHAHGGLIRLPVLGGLLQKDGSSFDSGLYRSGDTQLYVSRGLGGKGLRLWNRPEVALILLEQS